MFQMFTAAALGLAALIAVPSAAQAQRVERQTTVVERGPHGGERVTTRTTVRRSTWQQRRYYGRPGYRAYGRPGYHRYGNRYGHQSYGMSRHCWTSWYRGHPVRHCR